MILAFCGMRGVLTLSKFLIAFHGIVIFFFFGKIIFKLINDDKLINKITCAILGAIYFYSCMEALFARIHVIFNIKFLLIKYF
jgi:hypothetical protein